MYNDSKQPSALSSKPGWSVFNANNKRLGWGRRCYQFWSLVYDSLQRLFVFLLDREIKRKKSILLSNSPVSNNASLCQMTSVSLWFVILHRATVHLTVLHVVREIRQWCWRTFVVDCESCGANRSWLASFFCDPRWAITARYIDVVWRSISFESMSG